MSFLNIICSICGNNTDDFPTKISVTKTRFGKVEDRFVVDNKYEEFFICSKNPQCLVALLDQLHKKAKDKAAASATNAVGPIPPGTPGCAFNDPPDSL